ncbi:pre-toxin TG domain-containing protein [Enterococcus ureilyticus]|nr:pre-toxin TG domain-containing protein [Enterococcus ureilyticus]MBM7689215.1 hypothetical protein [Enterococcus ureilyticus]
MKKLGIALTNMAGEMTGMYSLYRLFTGTDPVTGSKVSRLEAGLWVALLLLPQAKMVEAVKTLRAGDRALAGAALTEADLMILSKAGYFDDVAKINKIEKVSGLGKNIENVNPSEIRFSQTSVNGSDEIIASMKANGWKGDPIDVVRMPDGSLTTLDNTRVAAAREVGIDVQATVRNYDDLLPPDMVARFTTPKGVPKTWGEATDLRIGKQKASFRNNNPMESFDLEKMK